MLDPALIDAMFTAVDEVSKYRRFRHLDPDDRRQEGLLACLLAAPRARLDGNAVVFFRVAANWALIRMSRAARRAPTPAELVEPEAREREAEAVLDARAAASCVARLGSAGKSVLRARYWGGWSVGQVAAERECSHQNITGIEARALLAVRRLMGA